MILTRIKRGAIRTQFLIHNKLVTLRAPALGRPARQVRSMALYTLAAYTVALPILALHPASAQAATEDGEPPSTQAISRETTVSVAINPSAVDLLKVANPSLEVIQISKSPATLRQEEAARQAELARQKAEQDRIAAEAAQQAYYQQQAYAAQQAASEQASAVASSATTSSGDVEAVFKSIEDHYGASAVEAARFIAEHESGLRLNAVNSSSGACGLFQALPCSKMGGMDAQHQADWVNQYVHRYGSWENAAAFWRAHRNW